MFLAGFAPGYGSLADPPGSSVLAAAVSWVEATLLGTVATSIAVIAISIVGFMMLSGRISIRPALGVILGSFILFGASTIAAGIQAASGPSAVAYAYAPVPPVQALPAAAPSAAPDSVATLADDPHAGAALPRY